MTTYGHLPPLDILSNIVHQLNTSISTLPELPVDSRALLDDLITTLRDQHIPEDLNRHADRALFVIGIALMVNITSVAMWVSANFRERNQRNILMMIASTSTFCYAVTASVCALEGFKHSFAYDFLTAFFHILITNLTLHCSEVPGAIMNVKDPRRRKLVEYAFYSAIAIYVAITFALTVRVASQNLHSEGVPHGHDRNVLYIDIGFSVIGLVGHSLFLVRLIHNYWTNSKMSSITLRPPHKFLYLIAGFIALCVSILFPLNIALVLVYVNKDFPWTVALPSICFGFINQFEFLLDYLPVIFEFMRLIESEDEIVIENMIVHSHIHKGESHSMVDRDSVLDAEVESIKAPTV